MNVSHAVTRAMSHYSAERYYAYVIVNDDTGEILGIVRTAKAAQAEIAELKDLSLGHYAAIRTPLMGQEWSQRIGEN